MHDALSMAEELDVVLSCQLPTAHQLAMGLLSWRALGLFHACNAQATAHIVRNATFAVALASKAVTCQAAILRAAKCNQVLDTKFLSYLQHQGHCMMHQ